jgi:ribosome recycling factor
MDTSAVKLKIDNSIEHLKEELKKVRTGRAHPDMLSSVMVEAYESQMPLNQLANVTTPSLSYYKSLLSTPATLKPFLRPSGIIPR